MPSLPLPLPKPRMTKLVWPTALNCDTFSDGTSDCRSIRSRTWARSTARAPVTDTEIGTSCRVCSRLVAVTMISSTVEFWFAAEAGAGVWLWAKAGAPASRATSETPSKWILFTETSQGCLVFWGDIEHRPSLRVL